MTDITKCHGVNCPRKFSCQKYTAEDAKPHQFYGNDDAQKQYWLCFVGNGRADDRPLSMVERVAVIEFQNFYFDELTRTI